MVKTDALTADKLRAEVAYDADSGIFAWRRACGGRRSKGPVGHIKKGKSGLRRMIQVNGRRYFASRLAWLYVTGAWPSGEVDHENRNTIDDRWVNLRDATHSQNQANRRKAGDSSLPKGVWRNHTGYSAAVQRNKKRWHLGTFPTPEMAGQAYVKAASMLHGEFILHDLKSTVKP